MLIVTDGEDNSSSEKDKKDYEELVKFYQSHD